jgi:hypothetical protein
MKWTQFKILKLPSILLCFYFLAACSGGEESNNNESASKELIRSGAVGVLLTDKPADPDLFLAVNVTIESIDLLGTDDDGKESIYSGPSQIINLLDLKNESIPFAFQDGIPAGDYCKIRLTLSSLELVLVDETPEDDSDNETVYPKLPGNNKLDLNVRDCFTVESGKILVLQLDIDAGRSIHITGKADKYQFRPVVFVDALVEEFDPKMLRLSGEIVKYDSERQTVLVCEALPSERLNNNGCVEVLLNEDTALFDNVQYEGMPRALDEIFMDEKLQKELTVVGWPKYISHPYIDIDVSNKYFPPLGECVLWDVRLASKYQSEAVSCGEIPEQLLSYFVVVAHDGLVLDPNRPVIAVDALVLEYGEFALVEGKANFAADSVGVEISVSPGSAVISDDLSVVFQEGEVGVNGTRFVSKAGALLNYEAILESSPLQIDGVFELINDTDAILKAALVIVDFQSITQDTVTGDIDSLDAESVLITLEQDSVCGVSKTQLEVDLTADFDLMTVLITPEKSEIIPGGEFEIGLSVGINGSCQDTVFVIDSVVIVDDQRAFL